MNTPLEIIAVDDSENNLELLATLSEAVNTPLCCFKDPLLALQHLQSRPADIVIADYMMPHMDGLVFLSELKKINPEFLFLMITASDDDAVKIRALNEGATDFLCQPIDPLEFQARLLNLCRMRRQHLLLEKQKQSLQTEVSRAIEELQKSNQTLHRAQKIARVGSWEWKSGSRHIVLSQEAASIFGVSAEADSHDYDHVLQYVNPDDRSLLLESVKNLSLLNPEFQLVHRLVGENQQEKVIFQQAEATFDQQGNLQHMLGTVQDITTLKMTERRLRQQEHETLLIMSRTAEFKDTETARHTTRVALYSQLLARASGLHELEQEILFYSAPLHDIGKVGVPDHILLKNGSLTPEEFKIMQEHTRIGHNILKSASSQFLKAGAIIAHTHHEKFNGQGYPRGLKGKAIPLYGRIVAIADVFDALTSRRPYKAAWSFEDAISYLQQQKELDFDPHLVDLFVQNREEVSDIFGSHRLASLSP